MTYKKCSVKFILILFSILGFYHPASGQEELNELEGKNIYRPRAIAQVDTISVLDTAQRPSQFIVDSLEALRLQRIQDSIEARAIFVRDSIARRQHILDSVKMIKVQLPLLLDASLRTFSDNIILSSNKIQIIGDSVLSNYTSTILPITIDQPFTPWKNTINLSDKPIKLALDEKTKKISSIQAPGLNCSFFYGSRSGILKITGKSLIASTSSGKVHKLPVDSVFYDQGGRILKVKRYVIFSNVINNYQQGALLYNWLSQVKQFEYSTDNQLTKYQLVNFCERTISNDGKKVCFMVSYTVAKQGLNYILTRRNDPPNEYSDGTFTYEFDATNTLKSIAFDNFKKSENWKTYIELNDAGNVGSYVYENKGFVNKTLLINYYLNDPKAKNKIETISCTFEDDGVSYYQINNTTGKSRVRDRLTMEWSPWK